VGTCANNNAANAGSGKAFLFEELEQCELGTNAPLMARPQQLKKTASAQVFWLGFDRVMLAH
jgi:hypothetical protein